MLLLFAFSIAPKLWLHDILSGHKHSLVRDDKAEHIQTSGNSFQCDWTDHSLQSPFTELPDFTITHPPVVYISPANFYIPGKYSAEPILSSLRGPPAFS
jgi:hypothetical protein